MAKMNLINILKQIFNKEDISQELIKGDIKDILLKEVTDNFKDFHFYPIRTNVMVSKSVIANHFSQGRS